MRKTILLIGFIIITLAFILNLHEVDAAGGLNCTIVQNNNTCPAGWAKLLGIQNQTGGIDNAHVQNLSFSDYNNSLCCQTTEAGETVSNACTGTSFLRLSNTTNAHVQQTQVNTYPVEVCIDTTSRAPKCSYDTSCANECLLSMASSEGDDTTNAHVGACATYNTKVCCTILNGAPILASTQIGAFLKTPYQEGLLNYWPFEGDSSDKMKNNGPRDVIGVINTSEGRVASAFDFDGVDDYIEIRGTGTSSFNTSADARGNETFAAWIKTSATLNNDQTIIGYITTSIRGKMIYVNESGHVIMHIRGGSGSDSLATSISSVSVNDGQWHFITGTTYYNDTYNSIYNGYGFVKVYVDGQPYSASNFNITNMGLGGAGLKIGAKQNPTNSHFNGTIDEVMRFEKALTDYEVALLYNETKGDYVFTNNDLGASPENVSDEDGDTTTVIYDWRESQTSIAVLNMPFDTEVGNTGIISDYSTYGNNATHIPSEDGYYPAWTDQGVKGGAFNFDNSSYISSTNHTSLSTGTIENYSISVWARLERDGIHTLASKPGEYHLSLQRDDSGGRITFSTNHSVSSTFTSNTIATGGTSFFFAFPVDFDLDGDMDAVAADSNGADFSWYENDGTDTSFTKHTIQSGTSFADGAVSIFPVDFDKDGDMDVVTAAEGSNRFDWYENDGTDTSFTRHNIDSGTSTAEGASFIFPIDFDKDGDMDVVTTARLDNKASWYENDGSDTTFTRREISSLSSIIIIFPVDFDKDGDMDVVTAARGSDSFDWWENNGTDIGFTQRNIQSGATFANGAETIFPVDFDKDGDMDVVTTAIFSDEIAWYENDGTDTSFTRHLVSDDTNLVAWPRSYAAVDFDRDGDMDIITSDRGGGAAVSWWENDGTDTGFTQQDIHTASGFSAWPVDFDGDGDLDVVSSYFDGNSIQWAENTAADAIEASTAIGSGWHHIAVSVNSTSAGIYLNGTQIGSGTATSQQSSYNLTFGGGNAWLAENSLEYNPSFGFLLSNSLHGFMDEIAIYNKSFSSTQFQTIYNNGYPKYNTLVQNETTKGENWTAAITVNDGENESTTRISDWVYIRNTEANEVTLLYPTNGDTTFTDRTPRFNWTSFDPDDDITYRIQVALDSGFTSIVTDDTTGDEFYLQPSALDFDTYYWRVYANDTESGTTQVSATWNFTLVTLLDINLTVDSVEFGTMTIGQNNDTSDDNPVPLRVENLGNTEVNLSINASQLFTNAPLNTTNYMYKADNVTGEAGAFNYSTSTITYTNMTNVPTLFIKLLNYTSSSDEAEIDLNVTVPASEPLGAKTSSITITGEIS